MSALYLDYIEWTTIHDKIVDFRRQIKKSHNFPVKLELHTKQLLLDKSPYRDFGFTQDQKISLITDFCSFIGELNIRIVNILINKPAIRHHGYDVMDTSLKYSVQRIENDLNPGKNPDARFMIITDEGRVGKMRKTTRAIQRINYIPSRFSPGSYRQEIQALIEDPLPKDSKESYFIQLCDLIAYVIYLYGLIKTGTGDFPNRLKSYLTEEQLFAWLDLMRPSFNLEAAPADNYGVKIHPN